MLRTRVRKTRSNPDQEEATYESRNGGKARPDQSRRLGEEEEKRREALELDWNFPPSRRPLSSHPVPAGRWPWGAAQESTHTCLSGMESRAQACHLAETEGVGWLGLLICFVAFRSVSMGGCFCGH